MEIHPHSRSLLEEGEVFLVLSVLLDLAGGLKQVKCQLNRSNSNQRNWPRLRSQDVSSLTSRGSWLNFQPVHKTICDIFGWWSLWTSKSSHKSFEAYFITTIFGCYLSEIAKKCQISQGNMTQTTFFHSTASCGLILFHFNSLHFCGSNPNKKNLHPVVFPKFPILYLREFSKVMVSGQIYSGSQPTSLNYLR